MMLMILDSGCNSYMDNDYDYRNIMMMMMMMIAMMTVVLMTVMMLMVVMTASTFIQGPWDKLNIIVTGF